MPATIARRRVATRAAERNIAYPRRRIALAAQSQQTNAPERDHASTPVTPLTVGTLDLSGVPTTLLIEDRRGLTPERSLKHVNELVEHFGLQEDVFGVTGAANLFERLSRSLSERFQLRASVFIEVRNGAPVLRVERPLVAYLPLERQIKALMRADMQLAQALIYAFEVTRSARVFGPQAAFEQANIWHYYDDAEEWLNEQMHAYGVGRIDELRKALRTDGVRLRRDIVIALDARLCRPRPKRVLAFGALPARIAALPQRARANATQVYEAIRDLRAIKRSQVIDGDLIENGEEQLPEIILGTSAMVAEMFEEHEQFAMEGGMMEPLVHLCYINKKTGGFAGVERILRAEQKFEAYVQHYERTFSK